MTPDTPTPKTGDRLGVGVNLVGYLDSVLGLGEVARQIRSALATEGVPFTSTTLRANPAVLLPEAGGGDPPAAARFPINLICANAEAMPAVRDELSADFFEGRHTIAFWWWEVGDIPERWVRSFDLVDEVWVGSHHVADALAPVSPVPVVRMPIPIARPEPAGADRAALGLPEGFVFLFSFDYLSVFERKNPLGLVEAFRRAFPAPGDARLVIKALHAERHPEQHGRLLAAVEDRPDIVVLERSLSTGENHALLAACDCYVSLHRAEGFGLNLTEALLLERPVIATGYSGPRDFLTPANAYLVDHELVAVGPGRDPYPAEAVWAEPNLDDAAAQMRRVAADSGEARRRAARGRADIEREHSPGAAGRAMAERLGRIVRFPPRGRIAPLETAELERRLFGGPPAPAREGAARGLLRRAVLRAIRPQAVHQRLVDEEILRALRDLDDRLVALAAAQATRVGGDAHETGLRSGGVPPSRP